MAEEHLTITYSGAALEQGRIDVRQLAPALLAMADAVTAAARANNSLLVPSLEVQAHRPSSFAVDLVISDPAGAYEAARDLLTGLDVQAALTASALVTGALGAFKWLRIRGRKGQESAVEPGPEPGQLKVTWPDGTTLETTLEAAPLADDMDFRRSARRLIAPLETPGIDELRIEAPTQPEPVVLDSSDVPAFDGGADDDVVSDTVREVTLRMVSIAFEDGQKWRVSDGARTFWTSILDVQFRQRVELNQESFSKGDLLRCELRERQLQSGGNLRMTHEIVRVLEHARGPRSDPLPIPDS